MHFTEYKKHVILAYKRLRDKGDLPSNLKRPTPAHIKRELLLVLVDEHRYLEKDLDTIRSFFGPKNNLTEYIIAIKNSGTEGTDKCRPLNTFLRTLEDDAEEGNTDDRNIYLLAILINFRPRPYIYGITSIEDFDPPAHEKNTGGSETLDAPTSPNEPLKHDDEKKKKDDSHVDDGKKKRGPLYEKLVLIIGIVTVVIGGAYLFTGQAKAYICENGTGKKYHLNSKCPFLKNCKNGIIQTTIAEAEKNGKTRCAYDPK